MRTLLFTAAAALLVLAPVPGGGARATVYNSSISASPGSLSNAAVLNPGDYIASPSGTYAAFLSPDVRFTVSRGSAPSTAASNVAWQTPMLNNLSSNPSAAAALFPTGEFDLYDRNRLNSFAPVYTLRGGGTANSGATMSLADTGALTINLGGPQNPGRRLFSNNVNDPVVALSLAGLNYDLSHATIKTSDQISGGVFRQTNNTATTQVYPASLSLSYTKTSSWSWSLSQAVTLGLKSTTTVGVPGVGQTSTEVSLTSTTTLTGGKGGSESESRNFTSAANVTVPAFSTYQTTLTGTTETYDVPYTFDGIATYRSGATAAVLGTGAFSGSDTGYFLTVTDCIATPGGCPSGPVSEVPASGTVSEVPVGTPFPVPEPASLALLGTGLLGLGLVRHRRKVAA